VSACVGASGNCWEANDAPNCNEITISHLCADITRECNSFSTCEACSSDYRYTLLRFKTPLKWLQIGGLNSFLHAKADDGCQIKSPLKMAVYVNDICLPTEYRGPDGCTACSVCGEQMFESESCSAFADTVCEKCERCPVGSYASTICSDSTNAVCSLCPPGKYGDTVNAYTCNDCKDDHFSLEGATGCSKCLSKSTCEQDTAFFVERCDTKAADNLCVYDSKALCTYDPAACAEEYGLQPVDDGSWET